MRRLGFLQLDPIATVATPQELVLWSRLGAFDRGELDRLLWEERALFEWNAFIWPIESLPMVRGLMRRRRTSTHYAHERWMHGFMAENRSFRRYVMRELERRGPLLSRELDDRAAGEPRDHRWYGARRVGHMLTILHLWGEIAVAGRRGRQRLWDLAERVYPAGERHDAGPGSACPRRAALPGARRPAREGPPDRPPRRHRRPGPRPRRRCSRRSTA